MNRLQFLIRSLREHRWVHLAVLLAVSIATAVLTGALIVGDSVRGSLRDMALERLGQVDDALTTDRYFRSGLVDSLMAEGSRRSAVPICLVPQCSVERTVEGVSRERSRKVTLIGCDQRFWQLQLRSSDVKPPELLPGEIALNRTLAEQLQVEVGGLVSVRLPSASQVPADSPLGNKDDRVRSLTQLKVVAILPARGLATFTLYPSQQQSRNAFVSLQSIQDELEQPGRVNAILVSRSPRDRDRIARPPLADSLLPDLSDFGIDITRQTKYFPGDDPKPENLMWDYFQITTDRLMWEPAAREAAVEALDGLGAQELLTYMANTISKIGENNVDIPYSTVTALVNHPSLGPVVNEFGEPQDGPVDGKIVLNSWAARRLEAHVGDQLEVSFFEPETTHGRAREATVGFQLARITPLTEPETPFRRRTAPTFSEPPTLSNDADLTPTVAGVTDQNTISDWIPPFPFDPSRIQPADDEYWDYHRTTPKAFISLADGQRLWGSRFGATTAFRVPVPPSRQREAAEAAASPRSIDESELRARLEKSLRKRMASLGYQFQPVRQQALRASEGTTPFELLFLGFSLFLIAASLMLIAVLFRLGLELRSQEMGTMQAVGWSARSIRRVMLAESMVVAVGGALLGIGGGVVYAALMLAGLRDWWVAAIVTPFLRLHVGSLSLLIGFALTIGIVMAVVWSCLFRLRNTSPCDLLTGRPRLTWSGHTRRSWFKWTAIGCLLAALFATVAAAQLSGEAQAGAFFGSGALVLTALLAGIHSMLTAQGNSNPSSRNFSPLELAWRTSSRNPGRSSLTIGLMAAAAFLIVAIAAFRLAPSEHGTGGFALMGESDRPIYGDLNDEALRRELLGDELDGIDILELRVRDGDDASCRNLYRAGRPKLLGMTQQWIDYFDKMDGSFAWAGTVAGDAANPWRGLRGADGDAIPVVLDKNTAMYSLHLPAKIGHEFELNYDSTTQKEPLRFRIAGLLSNSILQGHLLVYEDDLVRLFPEVSGYRMFLVRGTSSDKNVDEVTALLEERFSDEGLDLQKSSLVLADLLAVQNTYLSTFQSLGALGLLLGTMGLAAVQIRNIVARRSELALLAAIGFSRRAVRRQLVWENATLLLAGLGIGLLAAALAVIPHWWFGEAQFPLTTVVLMLAVILLVGIVAGLVTASTAARTNVIDGLRND